MRSAALAGLLLAGCGAATQPAPHGAAQSDTLDNVVDGLEPGWAYVSPERRFDPHSTANRLDRPAFLRGADLGYFGDPIVTRQYSRGQLATMRQDRAGFVVERDLDGDGRAETYRTGYWRKGDRDGTFLVVFDRGRQRDLVDTSEQDGVFLSWIGGKLVIADCNCPQDGAVSYAAGRLRVVAEGDGPP